MTDLFDTPEYDSDKVQLGMMEEYKSILTPLIHHPVVLLELGIQRGGSVQYWDDFLKHPDARIIGLDLKVPKIKVSERVALVEADQNDTAKLQEIVAAHGPFDLVIDDASHFAKETRKCWEVFWPHVRPGGHYVIEDWAVGYFGDQTPEFAGMVEVVTDLIRTAGDGKSDNFRVILETGKSMAFFQKK